jgi:hypothetical protein
MNPGSEVYAFWGREAVLECGALAPLLRSMTRFENIRRVVITVGALEVAPALEWQIPLSGTPNLQFVIR